MNKETKTEFTRKIYVLDDEKDIVDLVLLHLAKNDFEARGFFQPSALLDALQRTIPDLLLLDLMLPEMSGMEICKKLKADKKFRDLPVIMLTAKQAEADKVLGLELGADDYITKPFSPRELIARVKAVLRRTGDEEADELVNLGNLLTIDRRKYEVRDGNGAKIDLTQTEYKILTELSSRRGWVFSRQKLTALIWGDNVFVTERNIDVHIRHLREKLGKAGELILNIRGVGYKIAE